MPAPDRHCRQNRPHERSCHWARSGSTVCARDSVAGWLVQSLVVLLRYLFGIGSIWLSESDRLCPRGAVPAGGGVDPARRRPCAGRYFLCRRVATAPGVDRSRGRLSPASPVYERYIHPGDYLCRAVLGDVGALTGIERVAVDFSAQEPHSDICRHAGVARASSGSNT